MQAVLQANIFPKLIDIIGTAEFKIQKEAIWAIANATSGGSPDVIKHLVEQVCTHTETLYSINFKIFYS